MHKSDSGGNCARVGIVSIRKNLKINKFLLIGLEMTLNRIFYALKILKLASITSQSIMYELRKRQFYTLKAHA